EFVARGLSAAGVLGLGLRRLLVVSGGCYDRCLVAATYSCSCSLSGLGFQRLRTRLLEGGGAFGYCSLSGLGFQRLRTRLLEGGRASGYCSCFSNVSRGAVISPP
ncbi:unnamed protein product, partial [Laminaria digitata]